MQATNTTQIFYIFSLISLLFTTSINAQNIRIGTFRVNATPPIGSPVAYAPAREIFDSLSARGLVILSDEAPIVLCTVDWLGIANEGQDAWRQALAEAANTTIDRVFVHTLHQHDGMRCDFTTEKILASYGYKGLKYDIPFLEKTINSAATAVKKAKNQAKAITHIGFGTAIVEKVASNRRILGKNGKVKIMRWSKSTDSLAIAAPEGLIDPWLKCLSFWDGDDPVVVMTYYAVHPQSYYGKGDVSAEFVGLARSAREKALGNIPHIHFNGAGGNVAAGKFNDGSPEMRPILASRMEKAMKQAWEATAKKPISANNLQWNHTEVFLPPGKHLKERKLQRQLKKDTARVDMKRKLTAAKHLAWKVRTDAGIPTSVSSLKLGNIWLLNLPGELFVEYQLAAQKMRPNDIICTAAYGEYGMGYIGTQIAYKQGGYETSKRASRVAPEVEGILMGAIREVLMVK